MDTICPNLLSPVELQEYVLQVLDNGLLREQLEIVQYSLKTFHNPLYKIQNPHLSREQIQQYIRKYTQVFNALLAIKNYSPV